MFIEVKQNCGTDKSFTEPFFFWCTLLLAVPATSVASERLFSKAGNIITKKCNCLAASKADTVIFVMENL